MNSNKKSHRDEIFNKINGFSFSSLSDLGKRIFEEEQAGKERADYGTFQIVHTLYAQLS